jgi:hypothetical protein
LPVDPPVELREFGADLRTLAADAACRAWELATGAGPGVGLGLDVEADLARRAAQALGTTTFATLSARCAVPQRELARRALAWRHGGPVGFETLRRTWNPAVDGAAGTGQLLDSARAAVRQATGGPVRLRLNRLSGGGLQLRLGSDYRWYPYRRVRRTWEPAGPPATDPVEALGALLP